jgi:hypothetical protein
MAYLDVGIRSHVTHIHTCDFQNIYRSLDYIKSNKAFYRKPINYIYNDILETYINVYI